MSLSDKIKREGARLGFDLVGISKATLLETEARYLEKWLREGRHGSMAYMENYFDKRTDPRLLVEGAQSVISVIHNYFPAYPMPETGDSPKISRYAWGEDYHTVLKQKLYTLFQYIQSEVGETQLNGRVFVDSAPVMDKAWAQRSGLGWIGKNTNLITPKRGSYFFIGEIILDLPLDYDGAIRDYCGTCTRCIDACPTDALKPYEIDATRCISYLTIELRDEIPAEFQHRLENWAYGCDICQEVCPWNRFSKPIEAGSPFDALSHLRLSVEAWEEMTNSSFNKLLRKTAMSRVSREKFRSTLAILRKQWEK